MKIIRSLLTGVVALVLLPGLLGPATPPMHDSQAKVQPILAELAVNNPDQRVAVIVQKYSPDIQVESQVERLGGKVTKDLHIINGFAAEMSAGAALELAQEPQVRWISLDGVVESSGVPSTIQGRKTPPRSEAVNYYLDTLGVRNVWAMGLQGQGITVAVIDSGINKDADFNQVKTSASGMEITLKPGHDRIIIQKSFNSNARRIQDVYGHGTHVAGIIGGNGTNSRGEIMGIAPQVQLISLKVCDENGMAYESDVVAAMQWVLDNKAIYNIRILNMSINSTVEQTYHTSPMDAAAEILWFNDIVVVVSSGNMDATGSMIDSAPANDPFIITVGASDETGTSDRSDDFFTSFSAYGTTMNGYTKPDIAAPGKDIYSVLSNNSSWSREYPERVSSTRQYFRLSGTSMAAPMVSGAVALLLQDEPDLTPDQVKYRLLHSGSNLSQGDYLFPYLDIYGAITSTTIESANTGIPANQLLWSGTDPISWDSVSWNSVSWNSVSWNSVSWNSVSWNSVSWNSVYWGP